MNNINADIINSLTALCGSYFRLEFIKNDGSLRVANTKEKDWFPRGGENVVRDLSSLGS